MSAARYLQPVFFFCFFWGKGAIVDLKGTTVPTNQKLSVAFEGLFQNWACLHGPAAEHYGLLMMALHFYAPLLMEKWKLSLSDHIFSVAQKSYNF